MRPDNGVPSAFSERAAENEAEAPWSELRRDEAAHEPHHHVRDVVLPGTGPASVERQMAMVRAREAGRREDHRRVARLSSLVVTGPRLDARAAAGAAHRSQDSEARSQVLILSILMCMK